MGFWDGIKRQLRSVIEWNGEGDVLFEQWTENGDEIKNASQLIVGPGQGVIFVYEGKIKAVHTKEGLYNLDTDNIPFITTVVKFMQAFESEHKVGIYFFRTTEFLDQKWGTSSPIKYVDPEYKFPIKLLAYGNYSFRIENAENFFVNVLGEQERFGASALQEVFADRLVQPMTDFLAESSFAYTQIDKNRNEIAEGIKGMANQTFADLGFVLTDFRVESTSFDEETEKRIGRIADISAESQAAQAAGLSYAEMQKLEALKDAAANEGGIAGMGVGMGAGMGLGQMMGMQMGNQMMGQNAQTPATPASTTSSQKSPADRLAELKKMKDAELISAEEFETKKAEILKSL
jgi:membrane protease subunit (stomatin/prohibitin family)